MTAAVFEQADFQFYEDGTESGASAIGSQGANLVRTTANPFMIRIEATVTGMAANLGGVLRAQKNGAGGYVAVPATGGVGIRAFDSSNIVDDAVTTERLTGPNTFVAGRYDDLATATSNVSIDNSPAEDSEFLFSVELINADINDTDFFDLRLYNGTNALDTYTVTPRVTVDKPASALELLRPMRGLKAVAAGAVEKPQLHFRLEPTVSAPATLHFVKSPSRLGGGARR